jgi:hypothetical protein
MANYTSPNCVVGVKKSIQGTKNKKTTGLKAFVVNNNALTMPRQRIVQLRRQSSHGRPDSRGGFFDFGRTPVGKGSIFQAADIDADIIGGCKSCTLKNLRGLACKGHFRAVPSLIQ